eukprot:TRINITY_DN1647_c0_g1_i1.p1 TRINITY_DN1647_c0_g1~~TRINITY_DN1647_c0_g1_i1.p1  ORF type:complete len:527 (+),score=161.20 TRINITY_DN1647_c0_g1_i1:1671-3251(+)
MAVNLSVPTYRGDGIRLYGMDAELEQKMQGKRDKDFEQKLADWIGEILDEKLPDQPLDDVLKSGIILCRIVNQIWPGTIKVINKRPIALMEMENIGNYLKACWKLGVPSAELFVASDLYLKKSVPSVIQNLYSLARLAQSQPDWDGPRLGPTSPQVKPAKKLAQTEAFTQPPPGLQKIICIKCGFQAPANQERCYRCANVLRPPQRSPEEDYKTKLENENEELKRLLAEEKERSQKLTQDMMDLEESQRSLKEQVQKEIEERTEAMKVLSELREVNQKLQKEVSEQHHEIEGHNNLIEILKKNNDELINQIIEKETKYDEERESSDSKSRDVEQETQLQLRKEIEAKLTLNRKVDELNGINQSLKTEIEGKIKEMNQMLEKLKEIDQETKDRLIMEESQIVSRLNEEKEELASKIRNQTDEISEMRKVLEIIRTQIFSVDFQTKVDQIQIEEKEANELSAQVAEIGLNLLQEKKENPQQGMSADPMTFFLQIKKIQKITEILHSEIETKKVSSKICKRIWKRRKRR